MGRRQRPAGWLRAGQDAVKKVKAAQERACRVCGCTDRRACAGGCSWTEADLCSACAA